MTSKTNTVADRSEELNSEKNNLEAYFSKLYPECEVWISDYGVSASGLSNETRFFVVNTRKNGEVTSQSLGARWAPTAERAQHADYDISFQYKAMSALAGAGIPVPKMLLMEESPNIVGGPFFVMEKVEGKVLSDYPPGYHGAGYFYDATPEQRRAAWWESLKVMADVNKIDWRKHAFDFLYHPANGADAQEKVLDGLRKLADLAFEEPVELIEQAFDYLYNNIPESAALALCWSDGRPGNIIWHDYKPVAAVDWETMYVGAPENDLAWFIIVDQVAYMAHQQERMAGLPSTEETIQRYSELLGRPLDSMQYYFVCQALFMALMMARSAQNIMAKGIAGFPDDYLTNNAGTAVLNSYMAELS